MKWYRAGCWTVAAALLVATFPAQANMGLPLIAVFLPPLWVALVPIIAIEAAVILHRGSYPLARTVGAVALANVVSTLIGGPLFWFLLATIELVCCGTAMGLGSPLAKLYAVTVQAPWLIPYESDFGWMVPSALLTMGVLCAGMSILVEAPIVAKILGAERKPIWRLTTVANVASYIVLAACGWLVIQAGVKMDALNRSFMPLSEWLVETVFIVAGWLAKGSP